MTSEPVIEPAAPRREPAVDESMERRERARTVAVRAGWIATGSLVAAAAVATITQMVGPQPPEAVEGTPDLAAMNAVREHLAEVWGSTALVLTLIGVAAAAMVVLCVCLRQVTARPTWSPLPLATALGAVVVIVTGLLQIAAIDLIWVLEVSDEGVRSLIVAGQMVASAANYAAFIGALILVVGLTLELRAARHLLPTAVPWLAGAAAALTGLLTVDLILGTAITGAWGYPVALGVITPLATGLTTWSLRRPAAG
jgi:hypothetical protein